MVPGGYPLRPCAISADMALHTILERGLSGSVREWSQPWLKNSTSPLACQVATHRRNSAEGSAHWSPMAPSAVFSPRRTTTSLT